MNIVDAWMAFKIGVLVALFYTLLALLLIFVITGIVRIVEVVFGDDSDVSRRS